MNTLVYLESAGVTECFATYVTKVWFVTGMNMFVQDKIARLIKFFVTYVTNITFVN